MNATFFGWLYPLCRLWDCSYCLTAGLLYLAWPISRHLGVFYVATFSRWGQ